MKIFLDGYHYMIKDLTGEDVKALKRMINSACLNERRDFHDLKRQIEDLEQKELL